MTVKLFPKRGFPRAPNAAPTRATRDDLMGGWTIVRGTGAPEFQRTGEEVKVTGWERHPVVNACVRAIADIVAAVPLEVYRHSGAGDVVIEDHPATVLLRNPRASQPGHDFMGKTAVDFLLYGNAFWLLERRGSGLPRQLRIVSPKRIQYAWTNSDDEIIAYDWRGIAGELHPMAPVQDMLHFKDLDAADGLFGYPRLAAALLDIDADSKASNYVRNMLSNHGVPGMVVITEGATSIEDLRAAENAWNEKMVLRGERGRTKFVAGVKDVKPIGFDLAQLEFPDLRRVSREDICAACGVDPRMVGVSSASKDGGLSGVQYREARFRLIQQSVVPLMKRVEAQLNHWLMPEFGDVFARFSPDGLSEMTEDEEQTSTRMIAQVAAGIRTVEESRETLGLDGVMKPGDTLMIATAKPVPVAQRFDALQQAADAAATALDAIKNPPAPPPNPNAQQDTTATRALIALVAREPVPPAAPVTVHVDMPPIRRTRKTFEFLRKIPGDDSSAVIGADMIDEANA